MRVDAISIRIDPPREVNVIIESGYCSQRSA